MRLEDLAAEAPFASPLAAPAFTLGAFVRRSITFADGREDATTRVVWVQSHGLTGDIRIPADRPDVSGAAGLAELDRETLARLAEAEGGVADTTLRDGLVVWPEWRGFQPYNKWPEPGDLRRVGGCMIEFSPSGTYVEDWRWRPDSTGLLAGLRLVEETGPDGAAAPRQGGLVVAGNHAVQVLCRRRPLPSDAPAAEQIRAAADPVAMARDVFDCEASYLRREGEGWRVALAADPFQEGARRPLLDGFAPGPEPGLLAQACVGPDGPVLRLWSVDTLLPGAGGAA